MAWMKPFFVLLCIAAVACFGILHHSLPEISVEDSNAGAWSAVRERLRTVYFIGSSTSDRISARLSEDELTLRSTDRISAQSGDNELAQRGSAEHKSRVLSEAGSQKIIDSKLSEKQEIKHGNQAKPTTKDDKSKGLSLLWDDMAAPNAKVRYLRDQLIRARVYLGVRATRVNPSFTRELRSRIKDIKRLVTDDVTEDSQLPENVNVKLEAMDRTLAKGKHSQDDCPAVIKKLSALVHLTEERLQAHKKYMEHLTDIAAKTVPKELHCLSLRLTSEYHALDLSQQKFPNQEKFEDPKLYHYALFTDNILAAAVVVNSTVLNAKHPADHVFHIVTNGLNFAGMKMWFLANPPRKATIEIQNIEEFAWLNASYSPVLRQLLSQSMIDYYFKTRTKSDAKLKYRNPKYLSILNHLRFYLPQIFPKLDKVVFLDDDIVVQKDLTNLWRIDLEGKVNGAVETCGENFHRFDTYLNFSNPLIAKNFDRHACGWAFGMNVFDLSEWRKQELTEVYHYWQNLRHDRMLWNLGTLPPGLITFYNHTYPLDRSWHVLGLGYDLHLNKKNIERAAVIHYNGIHKPWLEIVVPEYRNYWSKYVNYDQRFLQECNFSP